MTSCKVEGCTKPTYVRGWCRMHYARWYRNGNPTKGLPPHGLPLDERLRLNTLVTEGCWLWLGAKNANGYGVLHVGGRAGRAFLAHRLTWEAHKGPIPDGQFALHHCDNPPCVNPAHLFLGSQADNCADMKAKGRGDTSVAIKARWAGLQPRTEERTRP